MYFLKNFNYKSKGLYMYLIKYTEKHLCQKMQKTKFQRVNSTCLVASQLISFFNTEELIYRYY